ncbi:hypothetical protein BLA24_04385 [Streptomyces cinnamoneus]|uniref:Uncharacterized protein n=1 Tax=Streptomyces cinnamoneus TaxID=53446 RepID=A0A2G1XP37_STRCJ|nr:hypothetical protein BLA24_04385 [Streptomyces cinnamoneus]
MTGISARSPWAVALFPAAACSALWACSTLPGFPGLPLASPTLPGLLPGVRTVKSNWLIPSEPHLPSAPKEWPMVKK